MLSGRYIHTHISVDIYLPTGLHDITSLKGTCVASHLVTDMRNSSITRRLSQKTKESVIIM
jgi:hypothetical protein